jgi:hypothetical protein
MAHSMSKIAAIVATTAAALAAPALAAAEAPTDGWTYSLMPYVWLPTAKMDLSFGPKGGQSTSISVSPNDYLSDLEFAFMIEGEARKERWLVATDFMYLNFGTSRSDVRSIAGSPPIVNTSANVDLKGVVWTAVGGYAAIAEPKGNLDLIAGFRYLSLKPSADWQVGFLSGNVSNRSNIWTAIVGAKGQVKLGDTPWFVPYYLDVGGGDSATTWQAALGLGYAYRWGDVRLDYRYLSYSDNGNRSVQNLDLGGLALGVNFRF